MRTLASLLEDHATRLRSLNYAERSVTTYRDECRLFLAYLEKEHLIRIPGEIAKSSLILWQNHIAAARNRAGMPLSTRTINRKVSAVKGFLRFLADAGFLAGSVAETPRHVREPRLLPTGVLQHQRIRRTLSRMPTGTPSAHRNRTMLELLYSTGLRARELLGLDVSSVDLATATARVMGKGRKERVVPIGRTALRLLESHIVGVRPFLMRHPGERALFLSPLGRRLSYNTFRLVVHRNFDRDAEIAVSPHTFRRSCATELIKGGANLYHVKEILGHESLDTLKHYVKLTIADLRRTHGKCHPREKDE